MKLKNILGSALGLFVLTIGFLVQQNYLDLKKIFPSSSYEIYMNCNDQMKHNVCAIMNTKAGFSDEVKQIYLPVVGPINADIYRQLLGSGLQMCQVVRDHCDQNLKSEICQIGQVLYLKK